MLQKNSLGLLAIYLAFSLFSFFYDNVFATGCISLLTITVKTEGFFKFYIYIMQTRIVVIQKKFITILFGIIRNTNWNIILLWIKLEKHSLLPLISFKEV